MDTDFNIDYDAIDILDLNPRRLLSLDTDFGDDYVDPNEESEDELYYREVMEIYHD